MIIGIDPIIIGVDPGANKRKTNFALAVRYNETIWLRSLRNPKANEIAACLDSMNLPADGQVFAAIEDQYLDKNVATMSKLRGAAERARTVIELRWPQAAIRPLAAMTWHLGMLHVRGDGRQNLPREEWALRTRSVGLMIACDKSIKLDLDGPERKLTDDELAALCMMRWMQIEARQQRALATARGEKT